MNDTLEPPNCWLNLQIYFSEFTATDWLSAFLLALLLFFPAFFSGAETAFFSLTPQDLDRLKREGTKPARRTLALFSRVDRFLGTVLLGNNLVNMAVVVLTAFFIESVVDFSHEPVIGFLVQTVLVTFLLAFFGEVLPKTLAAQYAPAVAKRASLPLDVVSKILYPFVWLLTWFIRCINKRLSGVRGNVSIDELSQAVDITVQSSDEATKILKGIVRFVNIDVRQIMRPRVNVSAVEIGMDFKALREQVIACGYSRIPVYERTLDTIRGILYVKDLMPYQHTVDAGFAWQTLIRTAYFVPENKKINDLLEEFRQKKIHMAIVVDEYGGTEGIVTLEDILEEIVGEISDETD
jgi:gliding motility-associated protein GldE